MEKQIDINMINVVRPYLLELSERCGESSCLAVEDNMMVVYIDKVYAKNDILKTMNTIGKSAPVHCTSDGKLLLLNYDFEMLDRLMEEKGLEALTPNTITTMYELIAEIKKCYDRGYAMDNEECEEGVRAVAAPIVDHSGKIIATVSVAALADRMCCEKIFDVSANVRDTAARISRLLQHST